MTAPAETIRDMLGKIIADAEDRVDARQDAMDQCAAALSATVGPLATAHKLAEMAKKYYDFANHGVTK